MLFFGQALAQTNNPHYECRTGYDVRTGKYTQDMIVLPEKNYPYGVCLGVESELSWTQDDWTRLAMQSWNIAYERYKEKRWGTSNMVNIPSGPLFVDSCDSDKYNIIYLESLDLPGQQRGQYQAYDTMWDFTTFYGVVRMDKRKWEKFYFINVMIHELGHALALVHYPKEKTDIMVANGFGDGCDKIFKHIICEINDYDMENFLRPYDPEDAITRLEYDRIMRIRECMPGSRQLCP